MKIFVLSVGGHKGGPYITFIGNEDFFVFSEIIDEKGATFWRVFGKR